MRNNKKIRIRCWLVLFGLLINYSCLYSQKAVSSSRGDSKFEIQPGFLAYKGYATSYVGFSYNISNRIAPSLGVLIGLPFSNGAGIAGGLNFQLVSYKKLSLSADILYKLNSEAVARLENADSIIVEYTAPVTQFISSGVSLDVEFKDETRLRVSVVYNTALEKYKPELTKGTPTRYESEKETINNRLNNSFGIHIVYAIPIRKR